VALLVGEHLAAREETHRQRSEGPNSIPVAPRGWTVQNP
jgi:hypothetical protein